MKKIEAVIRPEKVGAVRKALEKFPVNGMTIIQVDGHGNQKGTVQKIGGEEFRVGILAKTKIEIICRDEEAKKIGLVIAEAAKTGAIGDGKIFISPIDEVIRIRTGETGETAL